MKPPLQIWKFEEAPKELQALSQNGGDEDWLALIPNHLKKEWVGYLEEGTSFGCYKVEIHKHPVLKSYEVRIGCHS